MRTSCILGRLLFDINIISRKIGAKNINKDVQTSIEELQKIAANEGLSENDLDRLVNFLVTTKLCN